MNKPIPGFIPGPDVTIDPSCLQVSDPTKTAAEREATRLIKFRKNMKIVTVASLIRYPAWIISLYPLSLYLTGPQQWLAVGAYLGGNVLIHKTLSLPKRKVLRLNRAIRQQIKIIDLQNKQHGHQEPNAHEWVEKTLERIDKKRIAHFKFISRKIRTKPIRRFGDRLDKLCGTKCRSLYYPYFY